MLEPVWPETASEDAYRLLLRRQRLTSRELAERQATSVAAARRVLDRLVAAGLATSAGRPARYTAVDPRRGLTALIRARQAELDGAASSVEAYAAEYHERAMRGDPHQLVEVIDGAAAVTARLGELMLGAEREVLAFDSPPYLASSPKPSDVEYEALARGVTIRAVYATEALDVPERAASIKEAAAMGEQVRLVPRVPLKMVMVDGRAAVLPLTASDLGTRASAVLVRQSRLLDALSELFEAKWEQGVQAFGAAQSTDTEGLAKEDRLLLSLLNAGLKDEALARQLGVSERTLRRRTADLVARLGATSRFQAGAQAVRRGWL
ncbi:helix-turn-helix transcriptional regulator [Streptomyces montanisoli]|uniref:Helix-turn-helix transcriptional regulator n=1 Tax=Streptomyces montanisoli TaxID=2798581 RepID=A0A940RT10_9ACTN|nr:helix-turn-helix transcriptional regulator [Streptomyces montanisoli]MBP0456337.1 helix-turn-helix transcriptional regulator [Streptomyces montanisoli]